MDNKFLSVVVLVLIALVAAVGFAGYFMGVSHGLNVEATPGAAISYNSSLGNVSLRTVLDSMYNDVLSSRAPLAGVVSSTVTLDFPITVNGTTSSIAQVTSTAVTGVAVGDYVLVSPATNTAMFNFVNIAGYGCATNTVCLIARNGSSSDINLPNATYDLTVLPFSSFVKPAATTTSQLATSSSQ